MKLAKPAVLAAALVTGGVAGTAPARAAETTEAKNVLALVQRVMSHYLVLLGRSFVDLTYDQLTIEPGTNSLVISGLRVYPVLDWDKDGKCEISVERIVTTDIYSFETLGSNVEVSGVTVPGACFDPGAAGMMAQFGYEEVVVDQASIGISYTLPSSAAEVVIQAAVKDALDVSITGEFSYLWFNLPMDGYGDPQPVVQLASAEVAIENKGLYEKLEPMIGAQMGDVSQLPLMIQMGLGEMLAEGGTREMSDVEKAFVENLAAEVGRFLTEKNRLVVTAAPDGGVWLDETAFDSPQNLISALRPKVSGVPAAYRKIVAPADMSAALADGATPDDATRMRIGEALVTGVGAPRSIDAGARLLTPLADAGNGKAAVLLAKAYEDTGKNAEGYEMALFALAAGEIGALGVADNLESRLPLAEVLALQDKVFNGWGDPDGFAASAEAAGNEGDVGALRKAAAAISIGRGAPRSYAIAYLLATVAAAGGDRGAANLRDRLNRRFGDDPAWREEAAKAESEALAIWTSGIGEAIANRAR